MVVEEAQEQTLEAENHTTILEDEVDSLKSQLADYQQALDVQQTRALQYQQAVQALEKAKAALGDESLTADNASQKIQTLNQSQHEMTERVLQLKHRLDMSAAVASQFEQAFQLVQSVLGDVARHTAYEHGVTLIEKSRQCKQLIAQENQWYTRQSEISRQLERQSNIVALAETYQHEYQETLDDEAAINEAREKHQAVLEVVDEEFIALRESRSNLRRNQEDIRAQIQRLESIAPQWIVARNALDDLREQSGEALESSQAVFSHMQQTLEREKQQTAEKEKLALQRHNLEQEIERLASPGGANDARLKSLADTLGGMLLSEIYDDITLEDAPYFSAMYGPARHAIVVSDLSEIQERLAELDDCPEDVYIIEGDVDAFDDSSFDADELEGAVCVRLNDRQIRYSRFPEIPLFGRAAREQRLEQLRAQRDDIVELHAKASFDSQKLQRLYQAYQTFVASHMTTVFEADPEQALQTCREQLNQIGRSLTELSHQEQQLQTRQQQVKTRYHSLRRLRLLSTCWPMIHCRRKPVRLKTALQNWMRPNAF